VQNDTQATLSRKTWDRYCVPATLLAVLIGMVSAYVTGHTRYFVAPLPVIVVWLWLRFHTPPEGFPAPTVRGTPGAPQTLAWLSFVMLLYVGLVVADSFMFGRPADGRLRPYLVVAFMILLSTMVGGVVIIERRTSQFRQPNDTKHGAN
jgi:hypothetical protein